MERSRRTSPPPRLEDKIPAVHPQAFRSQCNGPLQDRIWKRMAPVSHRFGKNIPQSLTSPNTGRRPQQNEKTSNNAPYTKQALQLLMTMFQSEAYRTLHYVTQLYVSFGTNLRISFQDKRSVGILHTGEKEHIMGRKTSPCSLLCAKPLRRKWHHAVNVKSFTPLTELF